LAALKLDTTDLFADERPDERPQLTDTYNYVDEAGTLLYQVLRYSPKAFKQRIPAGPGEWEWRLNGVRRVPFRLPELLAEAKAGGVAHVVEGEKDVLAIVRAGEVATCPAGGAKWKSEYAEHFTGLAEVRVVADRDLPGYRHARQVAQSLSAVVDRVVVCQAHHGKDVADHLAAGLGLDDLELVTEAELEQLCAETPTESVPYDPYDPYDPDDRAASLGLVSFQSRLRSPEQVKAMPAPRYLIDGLMVENSLGLVWGPWGSGKTFLNLAWAGFVGSGSWWLGREVTQTKVLWVAGEGVAGLGKRIMAFEHGHGIYGMHGVTFHHGRINLMDKGAVAGFAEGVAEGGYGLIFLDTLARCMPGGDENSAKDVGQVVEALDTVRHTTNAAVWALHHSTKEGSGARGISAYLGACDTELEVSATGNIVTITTHQQRDAEKGAPITLSLEPVNGTNSATVFDAAGKKTTISGTTLKVLEALEDDPERGVSASVWTLTSGVGVSTFYRHRLTLVQEGLVGTIPGSKSPRYVLTEQGRRLLTPTTPAEVPPCQ
jgi:hypothetical protein